MPHREAHDMPLRYFAHSDNASLWAVVPVKPLSRSKQRLAPLLSQQERQHFSIAMLSDVLSALICAPSLARVVVITDDREAVAIAREAHAFVLTDCENMGTTAAVTKAAHHFSSFGAESMLVIPADVPAITSADVESIAAAHRVGPSVTLIPAANDGGTNALACSPPDAISFCFGEDSFRRHKNAAKARGIDPRILKLAHLAHDIDRPDDVAGFIDHPSPTRSYAYLMEIGIGSRLRAEALSS